MKYFFVKQIFKNYFKLQVLKIFFSLTMVLNQMMLHKMEQKE